MTITISEQQIIEIENTDFDQLVNDMIELELINSQFEENEITFN